MRPALLAVHVAFALSAWTAFTISPLAAPALADGTAGGGSGEAAPFDTAVGGWVLVGDVAARHGLTQEIDVLTGRVVLTGGSNRVVVIPGAYQVCVNGAFGLMDDRAAYAAGDVAIPVSAARFIEARLAAVPRVGRGDRDGTTDARGAEPGRERAGASTVAAATPLHGRAAGTLPARARATGPIVVIDPGHGGVHRGAAGPRIGILEKDVNLAIAAQARRILEERGFRVVMTRSQDRHLAEDLNADLDARVALTRRAAAHLFVSIHANYAANPAAEGFEVYYTPGRAVASGTLARAIRASLREALPGEADRGVKTAGFRVIKRSPVPAVLVEVGFVSNPATERKLATEAYRLAIAEAIARGIERYCATTSR